MKSATPRVPRTPRREKANISSSSDGKNQTKVKVFCRLRPLPENTESCVTLISPTTLNISTPTESKACRKEVQCIFNHIFTSYSSQKEVFDHVALPLVDDLLNGRNGLLFTYGVTGSGKTYTLTGEPNNPGIMPRCINTIFNTIENIQTPKFVIKADGMNGFEVQSTHDANMDRVAEIKRSRTKVSAKKSSSDSRIYNNEGVNISSIDDTNLYAVFISYTEIYNNTVFDLLDESTGRILQGKILREDAQKNMYVNGVVEIEVKSASEAFDLFNAGQRRKRIAYTALNAESSRSHSVFSIRVVQLKQVIHNSHGQASIPDSNMLKIGQLNLVDLAGSERTSRTNNTGIRLREASSINNSLMSLRTCMEILRENQLSGGYKLIPYRDSRLTHLFKNYFEGEGSVQMIVCVNPSVHEFGETLHVMKFAEMSQDIKVTRHENRFTPYAVRTRAPQTPVSEKKSKIAGFTPLASFGPQIPFVYFKEDNMEEIGPTLTNLLELLETRKQRSEPFHEGVKQRIRGFRERLLTMGQDFVVAQSEIKDSKMLLNKERKRNGELQKKIEECESTNYNWMIKNKENLEVIQSLQNKNDEKDMKLNQNLLEREKAKQKIAMKEERMTQELDDKLRRQRHMLRATIMQKDQKIKKVREILDDIQMPEVTLLDDDEVFRPSRTATAEQDASQVESRQSGPQKISTTPRHRRSRSAGEIWLEHNAIKPVPLGTVLQPSMKKRKSVTKLTKASDITNPHQNKYCLLAQDTDTDGEMQTKLYKADIVPTCGGGAQVIFNDVEKLKQQSP